jgi:hypothetical protein
VTRPGAPGAGSRRASLAQGLGIGLGVLLLVGSNASLAAPTVPPELDPSLGGDAPAFEQASLQFLAPADLAIVETSTPLQIRLQIAGYPVARLEPGGGPQPYALLLVDEGPARVVADPAAPLELRGLPPGPHLLRAVLARPWGELVKAPAAFAMTRVWVGQPPDGSLRARREAEAWPDPKKPILTYVLPVADPGPQEPELLPAAPATILRAPLLDFFLAGAKLKQGAGAKVRVVLDKKELPLVRAWEPMLLTLAPGEHRITIDLLDRHGTKVTNAVNRSDRRVTVAAPSAAGDGSSSSTAAGR